MSEKGLKILNLSLDELQNLGSDYHQIYFNPDDAQFYLPKLVSLIERNNDDDMISFFQQVRANEQSPWEWYASTTKIFMRDKEGKPEYTITTAIPIDAKHYFTNKIERLLEENYLLRTQQYTYATLTKREREILALMAKDVSSVEMSRTLFLSEDTVKTHRRNIKKKISAKNQYDIIRFAQAFNMIK